MTIELARRWLKVGSFEVHAYRNGKTTRPGFWLDKGEQDLELCLWRQHVVVSWGRQPPAAA